MNNERKNYTDYTAPHIGIIELQSEQNIAASGTTNYYGDEGGAGMLFEDDRNTIW